MIYAHQARAMSDTAAPSDFDSVVSTIERNIVRAAKNGKYSVDVPVGCLHGLDPVAVMEKFFNNGFATATSGSMFWTISWRED